MAGMVVRAETLGTLAEQILVAEGMRRGNARTVADVLVFADLRGTGSHGISRLPLYLARTVAGVMALDPEMEVLADRPGTALLDAQNGFGQVAGAKAMEIAIAKAGETGCGAVGVRNSNHFGVAGYFARQAVRAGMIGIVFTNASPAMPPWKVRQPLLGTNPIAVGIPAGEAEPVLLDMSTSQVARGKIRRAAATGESIPAGWAFDASGNPTEDAQAALQGSMAPMGGAKGAGLSLAIDLLCGVLTGAGLTGDVRNAVDLSGESRTGHFFLAIDVGAFMERAEFARRVDAVADMIRTLPSVDGGPVFLPGGVEAETARRRGRDGIPVPQDVLDDLAALTARHPEARFVPLA